MPITIDPDTGNLIGQTTDILYTREEISRMRPRCPHCGIAARIQPMDSNSSELGGNPRRFYPGRHDFGCRCFYPDAV